MNNTQYQQLKIRLEHERTELESELKTIAQQDASTGDWVAIPTTETSEADNNVEADQVEDWNERRAAVADLETRYRNLTRALDKIAAGTYGVCEISGEPIEADRLVANPAARTNIANRDREHELPL
jgi:RNA polymerase-binding transcription factor DksA